MGDSVTEKEPAIEEPPPSKFTLARIVVAFWLLGLCNNYIYVIMLTAAEDIIRRVEHRESMHNNETHKAEPYFENGEGRNCTQLTTGAILLADIIPTLVVKLLCPFLPFLVHFRILTAVTTGIISLVLVATSESIFMAIVGVCFASFNSGLGEVTLLAYSTNFVLLAIAGWSSGTGGAGLAGSFAYAGMIESGLTPEMTLYISISIPLLTAVSFWVILKHPKGYTNICSSSPTKSSEPVHKFSIQRTKQELKKKITFFPKLLPFMIPVGLVYYFEYLINSGLIRLYIFVFLAKELNTSKIERCRAKVLPDSLQSLRTNLAIQVLDSHDSNSGEAVSVPSFPNALGTKERIQRVCDLKAGKFDKFDFKNTSMPKGSQFRWFNAMYQLGVFVSRSSVTWVHFQKIWIMAFLQAVNFILFFFETIYGFIPNVWIMFILIFWEGLLGGAAYVNTFYNMSYMIDKEHRLFALSIASVADTFGIVFSGITTFPLHEFICKLPFKPAFRWP